MQGGCITPLCTGWSPRSPWRAEHTPLMHAPFPPKHMSWGRLAILVTQPCSPGDRAGWQRGSKAAEIWSMCVCLPFSYVCQDPCVKTAMVSDIKIVLRVIVLPWATQRCKGKSCVKKWWAQDCWLRWKHTPLALPAKHSHQGRHHWLPPNCLTEPVTSKSHKISSQPI